MSVRVIEANPSGHHLYYVRVLAAGCPEPVVWVTSAQAATSHEARVHLADLIESGQLLVQIQQPWPSRLGVLGGSGDRDVTILPDGDRWLVALLAVALRRTSSYRVLVLRPERTQAASVPPASRVRRQVKRAFLQLLSRLKTVEVYGLIDAFGSGSDLRDRVVPVADPVLPRTVPVVATGPGLVVGLLGAVGVRKNPALLAAACRALPQARLVVVGGVSAEALDQLEAAGLGDRLVLDNRYVDEADLTRVAAGCDVVAVLHDNHDSSSGVLALAAQVGVPVLVPRDSRLAETAGDFGVSTSLDEASVVTALLRVEAESDELRKAARKAGKLLGTEDFVQKLAGVRS